MEIVVMYILLVNIYAFTSMGIDKRQAIRDKRRIKENHFFLIALIGGSIGIILGMRIFRHKTRHRSFTYGIPLCMLVNIITFYTLYSIY
ncbi:DUF1294 domain-containing protein [Desulfuribacillus alkaliarsenatis]|uniref:DUF1294 domain-containing protein n=1 Tax=Desulfuribacillus alkaliarsenatis TaxID=766136 RepID=A0A1E5G703_9FIRM|nr:DUF1294 domain-containing protein [Desulfuribacillus alkaliarsenatis]OEF98524.1 hypothetical protein BHF68_02345 [Desulfuribacillus alkaliarsenatis]